MGRNSKLSRVDSCSEAVIPSKALISSNPLKRSYGFDRNLVQTPVRPASTQTSANRRNNVLLTMDFRAISCLTRAVLLRIT